jgi:hypothetical protein
LKGNEMTRYIGDISLSLLDRLLNKIKIDNNTGCWIWQGGKNNLGYGMMRDGKKMRTAHRVSYEEHTQTKIPSHLVVMHSCDTPLCVNPQHLSLGTRSDNSKDMMRKGRGRPFGGPGYGMLGKKMPKTKCPHCSKEVANNAYVKYHGKNCKLKQAV